MTEEIDMAQMIIDAQEKAERDDQTRLDEKMGMYNALLAHVKELEYLSGMEEPTVESCGIILFGVGSQMFRVTCDRSWYVLHHQTNRDGDEKWYGGRDVREVGNACTLAANWIGERLYEDRKEEVV